MVRKIKRNYRHGSPAKQLAFVRRVRHAIANGKYANEPWVQAFLACSDKYDLAYNIAFNGDRLLIAERDRIWEELVVTLDEMAARLEAESVRNPELLLSSGFDLTSAPNRSTRSRQRLSAPISTPGAVSQDVQMAEKHFSTEEQTPAV